MSKFYKSGDPHDMYIGQVVEVLSNYYNGKSSNSLIKTGEGTGISSSRRAVCMSKSNSTYSAELYFMGAGGAHQRLYEIDKDVFDQAGTFEDDDYKTENLINEKGRLLYEAADEKQTMPWHSIADDNYKFICNWTSIMGEKED